MALPRYNNSTALYAAIAITLAGVFVADINTPLGIAEWILYVIPLALTLFIGRPWLPLAVAAIATVLVTVGYFLSTAGVLTWMAQTNRALVVATLWIIAGFGRQFVRTRVAMEREDWLKSGEAQLSTTLAGDQNLAKLGENALRILSERLNAKAGAIFIEQNGVFRRFATYAVATETVPDRVEPGERLTGQAIKDRRSFVIRDVPPSFLPISTGFGTFQPRTILIGPACVEANVVAVFELALAGDPPEHALELLDRISEPLAIAIRSAEYRTLLQELLHRTQQQSEELQTQSEELRVTNEELEGQTRALRDSQARLESQQAELEQTNTQLEEQAQLLEAQKNEVNRTNTALQQQARDLERASRYKSDFLANMSHELRTPLNSSLILAKLLSENREGNLTPEQIRYAQTIYAAGNDLLGLINDVLDLSKVEAGRMEIKPQQVAVTDLLANLRAIFEPLAAQKNLKLTIAADPQAPAMLNTDPQRLEQVLKNLVSNAIKFTDAGEVAVSCTQRARGKVEISVRDSGIGIPDEEQRRIFEPFQQAEGTNPNSGGTGLGLSISLELARLLGGELTLSSKPGQGSTFVLTIPEIFDPGLAAPSPAGQASEPRPQEPTAARPTEAVRPPKPVQDDREHLSGNRRTILIVEDDQAFCRILQDLAHELGFQSLIATRADEALAMAAQYLPSAVLLDIGLPDSSGLSVLDRLKADARTRHLPVHVVSGSDHARTALSMGAVGYLLKPVQREQLVEAFQGLETRLTQKLRRVLVVEDDPVQLESLGHLLASRDVRTVGVRSATECLERLRTETYDCMVLDLALPDASGFSLLNTLSKDDTYAFPPVIVYTGRELTTEEEQQLRGYSKSIIIKGAKSPERLLDEVTLFLHQVVSELPPEQQKLLQHARSRDAVMEGRRILVVEDDVRNIFALTSVLEPRGATVQVARNGRESLNALAQSKPGTESAIDLVLMDVMMPEMDGLTAIREIRKRPEWARLPIITLTAKAMKGDVEEALSAGANDYMAKPLDVEKLVSLIHVWMPR